MAPLDRTALIDLNMTPFIPLTSFISDVQRQMERWSTLRLLWVGRVADLKMEILSRFMFFFRSLILPLPKRCLMESNIFSMILCGMEGSRELRFQLCSKREIRVAYPFQIMCSVIKLHCWNILWNLLNKCC